MLCDFPHAKHTLWYAWRTFFSLHFSLFKTCVNLKNCSEYINITIEKVPKVVCICRTFFAILFYHCNVYNTLQPAYGQLQPVNAYHWKRYRNCRYRLMSLIGSPFAKIITIKQDLPRVTYSLPFIRCWVLMLWWTLRWVSLSVTHDEKLFCLDSRQNELLVPSLLTNNELFQTSDSRYTS